MDKAFEKGKKMIQIQRRERFAKAADRLSREPQSMASLKVNDCRARQFDERNPDLWVMWLDGGDMRLIVKDGSSPSWGR